MIKIQQNYISFSYQCNGFCTNDNFYNQLRSDFFDDVKNVRNETGKYKDKAIIILDGFRGHMNEQINEFIQKNNIIFKFIVLHSSYMSHHYDINLFYRIKKVLISQSSGLDVMKENSSFYITQEEKDETNKFL